MDDGRREMDGRLSRFARARARARDPQRANLDGRRVEANGRALDAPTKLGYRQPLLSLGGSPPTSSNQPRRGFDHLSSPRLYFFDGEGSG